MDYIYVILLIIFLFFGIGAIKKSWASLKRAWQAALKCNSLEGFYEAYASGFKRRGVMMILVTVVIFPPAWLALSVVVAVRRIRQGKLRFTTYLVALAGVLTIAAIGYGLTVWLSEPLWWLVGAGILALLCIVLVFAFAPLKAEKRKID